MSSLHQCKPGPGAVSTHVGPYAASNPTSVRLWRYTRSAKEEGRPSTASTASPGLTRDDWLEGQPPTQARARLTECGGETHSPVALSAILPISHIEQGPPEGPAYPALQTQAEISALPGAEDMSSGQAAQTLSATDKYVPAAHSPHWMSIGISSFHHPRLAHVGLRMSRVQIRSCGWILPAFGGGVPDPSQVMSQWSHRMYGSVV
eukprot:1894028-Rhodomonas_salina.1